MAWPQVDGGLVRVGLVVSFFWALVGQYVYLEAKREGRSAPPLRGLGWWAIGVVGAVVYLAHLRERGMGRLGWLGLALLLVAAWAVTTLGPGTLDRSFHAWAALFGGLFVLYWQFHAEALGAARTGDGADERPLDEGR